MCWAYVLSQLQVEDLLVEREHMDELISQHLARARLRMKNQANKRCSDKQFAVGDMVYMKLESYVQSSILAHANQKLSFSYFGPFLVIERVGNVAYCLQLPDTSSIHPVFHVSQLRLASGFHGTISSTLPSNASQYRVPLQILESRMIVRGGCQVTQVKVVWSELPEDLGTWEDFSSLKQTFLDAHAWGQAAIEGEGNVGSARPGTMKWRRHRMIELTEYTPLLPPLILFCYPNLPSPSNPDSSS
jgi:hypothetical protein